MKVTSSPGSRDSASCTSAIVRIRRTDSPTAEIASGCVRRRACRRSSEEIVCRLFLTRWWISRIVASLLSSSRSRLRSSVTSRSSRTPPVTWSPVRNGHAPAQQRDARRPVRTPRSPVRDARTPGGRDRRGTRARPAASRSPTPGSRPGAAPSWRSGTRTAPGRRRRARATPSPTRGAALESPTRCGNGNVPAAIISTKFVKISKYDPLEFTRTTTRLLDPFPREHGDRSAVEQHRDRHHPCLFVDVPRRDVALGHDAGVERLVRRCALPTRWRPPSPSRCGTWSCRSPDEPGRRRSTSRCGRARTAAGRRSEKSASIPHSDTSRFRWAV